MLLRAAGIGIACLLACTSTPRSEKSVRAPGPIRDTEFVERDGRSFTLGARPVRFVGANGAWMHGRFTRSQASTMLEAFSDHRLNVARIWALGETEGPETWRHDYAFRNGPDAWIERSFEHLDEVLSLARDQNVRLMLVLANRWHDHGGLPQYARWSNIPVRYDELVPSELRALLESPRFRSLYFSHLDRIIGRVQPSGLAYANDPAVFSWELFNEISATTCAAQRALEAFLDEAAAHVRSLDGNHLISPGHIGFNSELTRRFWTQVHSRPWVGYADTHAYPQHLLAATSPERLGDWLGERAALARSFERPLVVGEVGIPRHWPDRSEWFNRFFERAKQEGVAAVLPWILRPDEAERDDAHGIWPYGPRAAESDTLRAALRRWSKSFAEQAPSETPEPTSFPLGLHTIAAFVKGTRVDGELHVDPWAMNEGCIEENAGWLLYALDGRSIGSPIQGLHVPGLAPDARLRVRLNGTLLGTLEGDHLRVERRLPETPGQVHWLRLEALDSKAARVLRVFTETLPSEGQLRIRF